MSMHVLVFGGSRNIGYFTTLRLLDQGHSATLLLRNTNVFDNDERMKPYVDSGKAELVKGDALVSEDVKRVWEKATEAGREVDYAIFTMGATPDMGSFKLTKGFTINPPNITTKAILNVLCTMPESTNRPKFIAITSIGVTKDSPIPLVYKPLYGYLLRGPHADKLGLERVLAHASGRKWEDREPRDDITTVDGVNWQDRESLPASGSLEVLVIRPPVFVEPKQKGAPPPKAPADSTSQPTSPGNEPVAKEDEEKLTYRVGGPELGGTYKISREEIAHFIAENATKNWDQFKGKAITVSR
ncbi:hypothetical protein BJ322DRAFT_1098608 [Thelephora terrestris]|uniref:NAD(P)-binding domain-containing protein n=1 Tax=Thelephora terrestris TaxID=56493 RepID=A0A9P6HLD7_9AGAM|nr:hypothetical protein BJ322DRAFT_1098608 [Thelephora terrestris]